MKQSEIIENNKLIAEFMGLIDKSYKYDGVKFTNGVDWIILEYHSSWDWLMPVVEKIEEKCPQHPDWNDGNTGYPIMLFNAVNCPYKIENVFKGVVEYIKWYNTQNQ